MQLSQVQKKSYLGNWAVQIQDEIEKLEQRLADIDVEVEFVKLRRDVLQNALFMAESAGEEVKEKIQSALNAEPTVASFEDEKSSEKAQIEVMLREKRILHRTLVRMVQDTQ